MRRCSRDRIHAHPRSTTCEHEFHTQRSEFLLFARYSRQDSFNAEYGDANFDPFNPQDPNAGDTGITYIGDTRGRITVEPDYSFAISETSRIGTTVRYDNVNYYHNDDRPPGTVGLVGYDAGSLKVYFGKSFGPQFDFKIGPYVARYEADNNSNTTDNYGLSLEGKYTWSEIWETGLAITAEHSESTQPNSIPTEETNTNWGLEFYGLRKGQTDTLRYSIGHFIEPSTAASMGLKSILATPQLVHLIVGGLVCVLAAILYARSPALSASDRQLLATILHGREARVLEWLGIIPTAAAR